MIAHVFIVLCMLSALTTASNSTFPEPSTDLEKRQTTNLNTLASGIQNMRGSLNSNMRNIAVSTANIIGDMAQGNFASAGRVAVDLGLTALSMAFPVVGALVAFAWSMISGLFGGTSLSRQLQDLAREILRAAQNMINESLLQSEASRMGGVLSTHVMNVGNHMSAFSGNDLIRFLESDHSMIAGRWSEYIGQCRTPTDTASSCRRWQQIGTVSTLTAAGFAHMSVLRMLAHLTRQTTGGYWELMRTWSNNYATFANASFIEHRAWRVRDNFNGRDGWNTNLGGVTRPRIQDFSPCSSIFPCINRGADTFARLTITNFWRCRTISPTQNECENVDTGLWRRNIVFNNLMVEQFNRVTDYLNTNAIPNMNLWASQYVDPLFNMRTSARMSRKGNYSE
jgi:hypothetical protein